jgi:hypothetical protein
MVWRFFGRDQRMKDRQERLNALANALTAEDELGAAIRGHLYVEHELNEFIKARLPAEAFEALIAVRFEYDKKITLAVSLGLPSEFKSPLRKMGEIRNAFAHDLSASLEEKNVGSLFQAFDADMKEITQKSYSKASKKMPNTGRPKDVNKLEPRDRFSLYVMHLWSLLYYINLPDEEESQDEESSPVL